MSYTLKDGYIEVRIASPEARTGECKASEALKQGMAVSKTKDANGDPVVAKASGSDIKQGNLFIVGFYETNEVNILYNQLDGRVGAISSGERVVTYGRGCRIATDQYVGAIGTFEVGDYLEVGTGGNAGLFTNLNATPSGDAAARVAGIDNDKLIVDIIL